MGRLHRSPSASQSCFAAGFGCNSDPLRTIPRSQMAFTSGCNHPSFTLPWRTLLPYLVALHLLQPGSAQITVVAPSLRVTAIVGQDIVLHCHLCPCKDARSSDIRWIQLRSSGIVHHYQNGEDLEQMEEYKGRTELLRKGLSEGNLDLRITAVSTSDRGSYSCAVQDGDDYADAVVDLEVSDPFSMIILYWTVALAVIITILVGSSVINVFLYRKKAAQSRELKRKDAELVEKAAALEGNDAALAELPVILGLSAANLKILASKLMKQMEKLDIRNSLLKKQYEKTEILAEQLEKHCNEMDLSAADLKKQIAELVEQREGVEEWHIQLRKHYEKLGSRAANLKTQLKKLENEIEEVEKHLKKTGRRAPNLKQHMAELVDQAEAVENRKSELKRYLTNIGLRAAELKKYVAELKKRTEALETKESEQPSKEQD